MDDSNHDPLSFRDTARLAAQGNRQAQLHLVNRYGPMIMRVIRKKMNLPIRSVLESPDVQQEIWRKLFASIELLGTFESQRHFLNYVACIVRGLITDELRRKTQFDRWRKEAQTDQFYTPNSRTPSLVIIAEEMAETAYGSEHAHAPAVIRMRLAGFSQVEIADQLSINERTVRRILMDVMTRAAKRGSGSSRTFRT